MKRVWAALGRGAWGGALAAVLLATSAQAAPRRDKALEAQLLSEITELSSDAYEGREPGTPGEEKTLRWLGKAWFDIGLESGTNDPSHAWFAPVTLVAREPDLSRAAFWRRGRPIYVPRGEVLALTSGKRGLSDKLPVVFVGGNWDRGGTIARSELAGRVALLLDSGIGGSERQNALLKAGAAAVLTVLDGDRNLESVAARRRRKGYALASEEIGGDLEAFITPIGLAHALAGTGQSLAGLEAAAGSPNFAPIALDLQVTLEATTRETRIKTHNLIARLPGRHPGSGAVLVLAHWDHFGRCVPPPAERQICNGAVDNASGLAVLTEVARRLVKAGGNDRDIYFLATTGEELGLLGAKAFAENPPLPLSQIVGAINIDTVAIAPAGTPLAIVGKGLTRLDPVIAAVAKAQGRKLVESELAKDYVKRQDGWALLQHDVPAVLVSSAWGDPARIQRYFDTDYHRPSDRVKPVLELGGAAEDVTFLVALTRWLADPRKVGLGK